ncbi:MAG: hypothetical protein ABFD97_05020 [Syntrophobacter sp.]
MANTIDLAILAAVPAEILPLSESLPSSGGFDIAGNLFTLHEYHGITVAIGTTGIGKVNAAATAACILTRFGPVEIWDVGCSGAYAEGALRIADVLITNEWIRGDEGVLVSSHATPAGNIGIPLLSRHGHDFFDRFSSHDFEPCRIALDPAPPGRYIPGYSGSIPATSPEEQTREDCFTVEHGPSLTVGMASGDPETARSRFFAHRAMAENMEGSAVAQTCLLLGAPFLECRGISNIAGIRDKSRWAFGKAIANCHSVIRHMLARHDG